MKLADSQTQTKTTVSWSVSGHYTSIDSHLTPHISPLKKSTFVIDGVHFHVELMLNETFRFTNFNQFRRPRFKSLLALS